MAPNPDMRGIGPGLGSVDLREFSPASRAAFRQAAERAYQAETQAGPAGWWDPDAYPRWLARFRQLLEMWEAIDRGEPPAEGTGVAPPTGRRGNPGWDTHSLRSFVRPDLG